MTDQPPLPGLDPGHLTQTLNTVQQAARAVQEHYEPTIEAPFVKPGDHRRRDRVGRLEPRNPFDLLVVSQAVPGFLKQFDRAVPDRFVAGGLVECCECRERVEVVRSGLPVWCPGGCGRAFVRLVSGVWAARFESEAA